MRRPLQGFQQLLNIVVCQSGWEAQLSRRDDEPLTWGFPAQSEPQTEKVVDRLFERGAGPASFLIQKTRHILIESQGSAHIKMII